jgi:DNA-binding transcriptional LysR family regulator
VLTERSSWPPWHASYDADFARAGFTPRVVGRGSSVPNLLALVAAGVGVTRQPLSARTLRDSGVVFVPLEGDSVAVVLLRAAGRSRPAVDRFAEVVRRVAATTDFSATG